MKKDFSNATKVYITVGCTVCERNVWGIHLTPSGKIDLARARCKCDGQFTRSDPSLWKVSVFTP